ncbi:MAG: tetratricopeptide repeat protein [Alistipes sp.]|nr:tetratricopeptide repeat protein [Alistipes sp.]
MRRLLYILFLFAVAGAHAQKMPERRDVRRGNRLYDRGDYKGAIERYTQALDKAPECNEALYDLGNALCKAEMYDKAEQTMTRAAADTLRTDAERAEAHYNLGNAQFHQQKYKEALESYRRSLLLNPDDMEAKYNYAYTKKLLEQQQEDPNNGGGGESGGDQDQQQNGEQDEQQGEQQDRESQQNDSNEDGEEQPEENPANPDGDENQEQQGGQPQPSGISEQEAEQMLDAIQAQEDRTQDKLKEKQGRVVRGRKNW